MRILTGIDVPFAPFGGSLVYCDDLYSNLPEGVEVRFLTLSPPKGQEKWWSIDDVVMLDIEKARTQDGFMDYVARLREIVEQQIEDFKPDVIHCQHLNYGLSRAFAEIETSIPRIGICHGTDVQAATKDGFFKENLMQICDVLDLLVFPNQHMADDFFAVYGKEKAFTINPLGIPDRFFGDTQRKLSFDGQRPLEVLYVGRLLEWKGTDIAVDALRYVKHPMNLTVIGNEDQKGFKQQLISSVLEHDLQAHVTFMAQQPREVLLEQMFDQFDVIVFPSRRLEAFSLTVVEAQAKGLPVIYFPGGGITDTVGGAGIAMSAATPESLARALDSVFVAPDQLSKIQARGYKNAEHYRLSTSRRKLFEISQDIIASRVG